MAARLRQCDLSEKDIETAEDHQMFDARQGILDQVQLHYPIVYDNLDICSMHEVKRLKQLSIAMLSTICEYFDIPTDGFNTKHKAEHIAALSELVVICDCNKWAIKQF